MQVLSRAVLEERAHVEVENLEMDPFQLSSRTPKAAQM